jgi:PAS domain S-box-containing protein
MMVLFLPLFSALLTFSLAQYAWQLRQRHLWVFSFALLMLAIAEWSLGYTFELFAASLSAKLLWAKVEYVGIVSVPLLWFVFAWQYVERHQWLTRNRFLWLTIIPVTTFLFVLTNEFHGLVWQQTSLAQSGSLTVLEVTYGIWFWVHSIYSYLLLLIGSVILLQAFGRFSSTYRWQIAILLLGPLAPWIGNALYITGFSPIPTLDITPLAFAISGAIFAWGIFRLHLFDIVPIARRTLIDSMGDGMLVVDLHNRLVDVNPAFLKIVGLPKEAVIGHSIHKLLMDRPDLARQYETSEQYAGRTYQDLELNERIYDISVSPLLNERQQIHGRLIVLRDITGRKEIENELLIQKQLSEILVSVAWAATQDLDLDLVMNNVVQTAVTFTKAEVGSLILLDVKQQISRSIVANKDGELIVHQADDSQVVMTEGLAGWVVRHREAALISDTNEDDRWVQLHNELDNTRSVLSVPLMERTKVMGVLTMTHASPQHFTEQAQAFLQAAANQMALALRNAQSYDNQRRLAQNQSTLYQVLRAMSGHLDREGVLNKAAETITALTAWHTLCILMVNEPASRFISRVATGGLSKLADHHFDVASGIWGRALRLNDVQAVPDIRQDPDHISDYAALQSALAIPMSRRGHQLGVFYVESDQPGALNDDDRWLADSLAEAIALAVDNAQTNDSLRQYVADLDTLFSITRLISRSLMDEDFLDLALYITLTSLQFDMGLIAVTHSDGELYLAAERELPERLSRKLPEQGFAGTIFDYAFGRQKALYLADLTEVSEELMALEQVLPTAVAELQQLGIGAFYAIPLQYHEQFLGMLCLFARQIRSISSIEEVALHEAIGQQIATAVTNTNLYAQLNQQLKEQTALREAITAITSSLDLPTVLTQIAQQMNHALGCTSTYICSYEPENLTSKILAEYMSPEANEREKVSDLGVRYQLDEESPYDLTDLAQGNPNVIHDDDPRLLPTEREHMLNYGARSILVIPLRVGGQTIAYAEMWESRRHRHFTTQEVELAQLMAGQAAIAMENARLFASIAHERGRLETLIQTSLDGIILIGMDRRILVVNEMALELFNLTGLPEDWVNRPLRQALAILDQAAPQVVEATLNEMRRIEQGDEPASSGEYEVNSRIIHWLNLPVLSNQTPIGRLLVLHDVTQERLLERMRDDLTHTMVHDLRNPLNSMSLSLELLTSQFENSDDPTVKEILGFARGGTDRMLAMVNGILDISRLESGRMPVNSEIIDMPELVSTILRVQRPLAAEKNIHVHHTIAAEAQAWADKNLIERVLQNLVGNALKFTPADGTVQIVVQERETDTGLRLCVSVKDSGSGIPPEIKERLFQKFTTGSQTERGSGLGLAFCKMALEAHGEYIWVESSSSEGTAFTFTLPLPHL